MLAFIDPRIVAVTQILMAGGIIIFWFTWFRAEHGETWLPIGYVEHERVFVFPDSVMSALMIIAAILHFVGHSLADNLSLICGGMMLFLLIIDLAYFTRHGMFSKEKGGLGNIGLVIAMALMCVLQILPFV